MCKEGLINVLAELSVLMSLYIKEKPEYVKACFDSLLMQSVKADEWVVVEDGPLTSEMYSLLDTYEADYPGLIKRVVLKNNCGLGLALRLGIMECRNELIARMDTDDIAREDRFEKQLKKFELNPNLDICGSNIDEFEETPSKIVAKRIVPATHNEIIDYQKKRDAFNHMTVMFKKKAVLSAGNYLACPLMEDTYLWARMIMNGANCSNIPDSLVYVRIGKEMFDRRGGWEYFKKYRHGQKMVHDTGFTNYLTYLLTVSIQFFVALIPRNIRSLVFKKILHK